MDHNKRDEAVRTSGLHQLVTPVCGAVVLEAKQQFEQAGLLPVASDSVPSVPEPGAFVLRIAGLGLPAAWRLHRRRLPGQLGSLVSAAGPKGAFRLHLRLRRSISSATHSPDRRATLRRP